MFLLFWVLIVFDSMFHYLIGLFRCYFPGFHPDLVVLFFFNFEALFWLFYLVQFFLFSESWKKPFAPICQIVPRNFRVYPKEFSRKHTGLHTKSFLFWVWCLSYSLKFLWSFILLIFFLVADRNIVAVKLINLEKLKLVIQVCVVFIFLLDDL